MLRLLAWRTNRRSYAALPEQACVARRPNLRANILNTTQKQPVSTSAFVPALPELVRGDAALLRELIGMFFEDCPQQMGYIRAAVRERDAAGLRSAAHLLRGSIGNFGLSAAYEEARTLEAMGRDGRLDNADVCFATLEAEVARLQTALAEFAASAS
jgi:HPt (histidine-containing phosphotransfer) domain-containing protein